MGVRYMVPMADMANFAPCDEQLDRSYAYNVRGDLFASTHRVEKDRLIISADRSAEPGEELLETYGDNPNSIYFQYHGFVPSLNPSACVSFSLVDMLGEISAQPNRRQ